MSKRARQIAVGTTLGAIALIALAACGPSEEERAQACVADYFRESQAIFDNIGATAAGLTPAEMSLRINSAVLLADSEKDWANCPADFRTARNDALAAMPAYRESVGQLMGGPALDMDSLMAMRDALVNFRAGWRAFAAAAVTQLDDDAVTAQLQDAEYQSLKAYLQQQLED